MPRTLRSLVAALLLSFLVQSDTVHAQSNAVQSAPPAPIGSAQGSASHFPLRPVTRAKPADRSADTAAHDEPIPIPKRKRTSSSDKLAPLEARRASTGRTIRVVLSSMAIVLGLFFLVVWLARRALPKSATTLPTDVLEVFDVLEVLGRCPLGGRHQLQLIRVGHKLLLVSITSEGAKTLTEITDPDEVNHLTGLCRQGQSGSITNSFRQVLHQLGTQPTSRSRPTAGSSDALTTDLGVAPSRRSPLQHTHETP
jgi:flagellar biogenesis protein FliO